jgi:hypothetical protein
MAEARLVGLTSTQRKYSIVIVEEVGLIGDGFAWCSG